MNRRALAVFAGLTLAAIGWAVAHAVHRYRVEAPFHEAWTEVEGQLGEGRNRIEGLEAAMAAARDRVAAERAILDSLAGRIAAYEDRAVRGRLPARENRGYRAVIDVHNVVVERHNAEIATLRDIYGRYAYAVDSYNVVVDSANRLRRAAAERGIRLLLSDGS